MKADEFQERVIRRPLAAKVMAVATTRIEGTWSAYIDAVPGQKHSDEWQEVLGTGNKLDVNVAKAIFPEFKGVPYAF